MATSSYIPPPPYGAQHHQHSFPPPPGPPPSHSHHQPPMPPQPQHLSAPHLVPYNSGPSQPIPPQGPYHQPPPRSPYQQPPPPSSSGLTIKPQPALTFLGPKSESMWSSKSSTLTIQGHPQPLLRIEVSKHSKPHLTITRMPSSTPLATITFSSLSGSATISFPPSPASPQGQPDVKLSQDQLSLSGARKGVHHVLGEVSWKETYGGVGGVKELRDQRGAVVARFQEDWSGLGAGKLEVFVQGDEAVVDFVVASCVAVVKGEEREAKKVAKILGEVL